MYTYTYIHIYIYTYLHMKKEEMSHALEAARGLSTYSVNSVNKASSRGVDLSSMSTTTRHIRPDLYCVLFITHILYIINTI